MASLFSREFRIIYLELGFLILLAPFALFPSPFRFLAFLLLPVLWLLSWRLRGQPLSTTPLNLPILIMSLMMLVSLYATYDLNVSLSKIAGLLFGLVVFYICAGWQSQWRIGFALFASTGFMVAVVSLVATRWTIKFDWLAPLLNVLPNISLPFLREGFHPNEVAGALLWVIFPLLSLMMVQDKRIVFAGAAASAVVVGVFILTQSRGGYFALVLTLFLSLVLLVPSRVRWLVIGILVVVAIIGGGIGLSGLQQVGGDTLGSSAPLESVQDRLELWSRALYGIGDFPLTGMGMNTFRYLVHALYPLFLTPPDFDIGHAHNELLQVALDLGLPGLIAFVSLNVMALWMLYETWRVSAQSERMIVIGLMGGLISHALYGMTDAIALGAKPSVLFWMLLGVIVAIYKQQHLNPQRIRHS